MKLKCIDNLLLECSNLLAYLHDSDDLLTAEIFINMLIRIKRKGCKL